MLVNVYEYKAAVAYVVSIKGTGVNGMGGNEEWLEENGYLQASREIIRENMDKYEQDYNKYHEKSRELFQAMQGGDVELYDQVMTITSLEEQAANQLKKNRMAFDRPYFGRIDFVDCEMNSSQRVYIGKYGIVKNKTEVVIADWRAPVSSIYYENELGRGSYYFYSDKEAEGKVSIEVDLQLKRNYDIGSGQLKGYYDSDVASNDELLIKYLSQNKETVLGEIIATIQKEQNEIIRESPFVNQIVQGVAGSGKTTVAMHRISYILYNYKERFLSNEFCIIGGSDLLLQYITSGLPELDVYNVKQKKMDQMFIHLLKKTWKKKNTVVEPSADAGYRCNVSFIRELEDYLAQYKKSAIPLDTLSDAALGVILTRSANETLYDNNPEYSLSHLLGVMDERVRTRIASFTHLMDYDMIQARKKEYRGFYKKQMPKGSIYTIYEEFLLLFYQGHGINETEKHLKSIKKGIFDIYDLAALVMIYYRIFQKEKDEEFGQIFIDEAQDFGSGIYYVLRKVLPQCYFTIMGDVSQNINYDTGMNDWNELKETFLTNKKDRFKLLTKSYRNTIEISEYAGVILEKASEDSYKIDPVIRHGLPVVELEFFSDQELVDYVIQTVQENRKKGYTTCAVICQNEADAARAEEMLALQMPVADKDADGFREGLMVLPVQMTKGLEFDTVILWNPQMKKNLSQKRTAKLMYVAVTRALHELHVLHL